MSAAGFICLENGINEAQLQAGEPSSDAQQLQTGEPDDTLSISGGGSHSEAAPKSWDVVRDFGDLLHGQVWGQVCGGRCEGFR